MTSLARFNYGNCPRARRPSKPGGGHRIHSALFAFNGVVLAAIWLGCRGSANNARGWRCSVTQRAIAVTKVRLFWTGLMLVTRRWAVPPSPRCHRRRQRHAENKERQSRQNNRKQKRYERNRGQTKPGDDGALIAPRATVPNYTLWPLDVRISICGSPVTVGGPTNLSELLRPNMGVVEWAACLL